MNQIQELQSDVVMKKLWLHLLHDFRANLGDDFGTTIGDVFLKDGVKGLRSYIWPGRHALDPARFKAYYQMETLFRRYCFREEPLTDKDRRNVAIDKFMETQSRLGRQPELDSTMLRVLQGARRVCKSILGKYDSDEHFDEAVFGRNASVGTPYAMSFIDVKLGKPLTGSAEHIAWFNKNRVRDSILSRMVARNLKKHDFEFYPVSKLKLTTVPKSYKTDRVILANTDLGSFYTLGLGRVIARRLCRAGLDIRRLQDKHRKIVAIQSRIRKLATADLSSASDSITIWLLRWLLPAKWYRAVMLGRIQTVAYKSGTVHMNSVITMGMGHTFPLQTLVFYALLRSIAGLVKCDDRDISVYGDDLIYPVSIHKYVAWMFPKLGLILNQDKTYVHSHFRESCGSDSYRGCDVRPFQPEGRSSRYRGSQSLAFLYKLYNGLCRRWTPDEISGTLRYLRETLVIHAGLGRVHQVPPSFPDTSGVWVEHPSTDAMYLPVREVKCILEDHYGQYVFQYLKGDSGAHFVKDQYPYYWESLRRLAEVSDPVVPPNKWVLAGHPLAYILISELRSHKKYEPWKDTLQLQTKLQWRKIRPKSRGKRPEYIYWTSGKESLGMTVVEGRVFYPWSTAIL